MRIAAYKKYFFYLKNYGSISKVNNILLNKREFSSRKTTLKSLPYLITIDPSSHCNLRCPACPTGSKHEESLKANFLKFTDYKIILDQLKNYTLTVALYNWGEPFLNKEIFDMISYSTQCNVGTTIHSNFNLFNEEMAENCVKSGLTHIYLSIDGATQEVYEKYRVRGNIEAVIDNIKILNAVKKKHNTIYPLVTWKFLSFSHNSHEVEKARAIAKELNITNFEVFPAFVLPGDILEEGKEYLKNPALIDALKGDCGSLWSSMYIAPNGTVFPCSLSYKEMEAFGNILTQDVSEIWNNDKYKTARSIFTSNMPLEADVPHPCKGCKYYIRNCSLK